MQTTTDCRQQTTDYRQPDIWPYLAFLLLTTSAAASHGCHSK